MTDQELRDGLAGHGGAWSRHALREAQSDRLDPEDVETALVLNLRILRTYPEDRQGESALVLCHLGDGRPIHAVIGYGRQPWTIVTVYVPDPERWSADFTERRS